MLLAISVRPLAMSFVRHVIVGATPHIRAAELTLRGHYLLYSIPHAVTYHMSRLR